MQSEKKTFKADLYNFFKLPAIFYSIGLICYCIFNMTVSTNEYVGLIFGVLTIIILATGCFFIIYNTLLTFKRDKTKDKADNS